MKKPVKNKTYLLLVQRIRNIRLQKNYTEKAIAEALDLTQPAYHQKENGIIHFRIEELFKLTSLFKICIIEFFQDCLTAEEFSDYATSQGYTPAASYDKKIKLLRLQINKLHTDQLQLKNTISRLEQDKKFLRGMLNNLSNRNENKLK